MDIPQFRLDFPEFADAAVYTNSNIAFWSIIAEANTSEEVFGTIYNQAVELYTAHSLVLSQESLRQSSFGGIPGGSGGAQSSKSVGSGSVSYATGIASEVDAGHWNQTSYGRQYISLVRLYGQGCIQL